MLGLWNRRFRGRCIGLVVVVLVMLLECVQGGILLTISVDRCEDTSWNLVGAQCCPLG
jgi:hypothetical protein